ncbi:MAG: hypothetical protein AAF525_02140 [Pseudomonadota bacterium]
MSSSSGYQLSQAAVDQFHEDGFLMIPDYFPVDEIARFSEIVRRDREILLNYPYTSLDADGRPTKLCVWS